MPITFHGIEKSQSASAQSTIQYDLVNMEFEAEVDGEDCTLTPFLTLTPALPINKPYQRAKLAVLNEDIKAMKKLTKKGVTCEFLEAQLEQDRPLYVKYIIKGWGNMLDGVTKEPIPFSKKTCAGLLDALPDFEFEAIREAASTMDLFLDEYEAAPLDEEAKEELAKN